MRNMTEIINIDNNISNVLDILGEYACKYGACCSGYKIEK